jgi:hypothetical protein
MGSTTFFGNRARIKIITNTAVYDADTTFANGSALVLLLSGDPGVGNYIYNGTSDTPLYASRVRSFATTTATLEYLYGGTSLATTADCTLCTLETLAVLRGIEVVISWETAQLFGTDDITRADEAKHNFKIDVGVKYCKFNPGVTSDWALSLFKPSATAELVGDGTIENTNVLQLVNAIVLSTGSDGQVIEFVFSNLYFEGIPFPTPENDFLIRDIKGHARDVIIHSYTPP